MAMQLKILSFWSVFCSVIFVSAAMEYSNRWTVQIDGDDGEADKLARKHGFVNLGKVSFNDQESFLETVAESRLVAFVWAIPFST